MATNILVNCCHYCCHKQLNNNNNDNQQLQALDLRVAVVDKSERTKRRQESPVKGQDAGITIQSKELKETKQQPSQLVASKRNNSTIRRNRTMFSEWQLGELEWRFERNKYLITSDRLRVAKLLNLNQLQVKTWFQNRRMKWKKEILASGCQRSPTKPKGRPRRDSIPPIDDDDHDVDQQQ